MAEVRLTPGCAQEGWRQEERGDVEFRERPPWPAVCGVFIRLAPVARGVEVLSPPVGIMKDVEGIIMLVPSFGVPWLL